jgi:hypothetical protein
MRAEDSQIGWPAAPPVRRPSGIHGEGGRSVTAWLWVLVGIGAYLLLSALATLGFGVALGRRRRAEHEPAGPEWATAPLTRERRGSADRARELVGATLRVPLRASRAGAMAKGAAPRAAFVDALRRGDVIAANAAAKEMGGLDLGDALAFCVVLAECDPARYRLSAPRWISRFVDECGDVSVEEAQLVQAAFVALPAAPLLARPVLRELVRTRHLVTVSAVFEDVVAA